MGNLESFLHDLPPLYSGSTEIVAWIVASYYEDNEQLVLAQYDTRYEALEFIYEGIFGQNLKDTEFERSPKFAVLEYAAQNDVPPIRMDVVYA